MRALLLLVIPLIFLVRDANAQAGDRPSHRIGHAVAFDVARGRLVLFGGADPQADGAMNDTWEWDGNRWYRMVPAQAPPPRFNAPMVYDPARGRIVLFGGFTQQGALGDMWEWDGTTWTERTSTDGPGPRAWHSMIYDPGRERVVLVGGLAGSIPSDDMWEWDGNSWRQLLSGTDYAGMGVFDVTRSRAYRAVMRSDLRNLVTAQEGHFADHFTYATSVDGLGDMYTASTGVTVSILGASPTGWAGIAVHEEVPGAKCGIFAGTAKPPFPEVQNEAEPVCVGFP